MRIARSHKMTRQSAKDKAEDLLPQLLERHGDSVSNAQHRWQEDKMQFSFRAKGMDVSGSLEITDSEIVLDIRLPWQAELFEDVLRSSVDHELDQILGG